MKHCNILLATRRSLFNVINQCSVTAVGKRVNATIVSLTTSLRATLTKTSKMNFDAAKSFSTLKVNNTTESKSNLNHGSVGFISEHTEFPTSSTEDHLQRTANNQRESKIVKMKVSKISSLSPTVKHLVLNTSERPVPISFKAGQWVDMFIPEVDTVGGFSICSSPIHLSKTGEFHLSVKKSDHPPSEWVHEKCKEGNEVSVRIGGDFFLDTNDPTTAGKTILLFGGGVGINPLASIVAQLQDYQKNFGAYSSKTLLMFSAKSEAELLFSDLFDKAALQDPSFSVQYFVTGKDSDLQRNIALQQDTSKLKYGRITKSDIIKGLTSYLNLCVGFEDTNRNILVYICGPPPMIQHIEAILKSLGITNILYEKWW